MKKRDNKSLKKYLSLLIFLLTVFVINIGSIDVAKAVSFSQGYNYTGGQQTLTVPYTGTYKLRVWGASGGNYNSSYLGGFGGYSVGMINLRAGEVLYINVGGYGYGNGRHENLAGGYNGGGPVTNINSDGNVRTASGGGATHIATASGQLSQLGGNPGSVLIVAGGGGGAGANSAVMAVRGGAGGGFTGGAGGTYTESNNSGSFSNTAYGGTQTAGGWGNNASGTFGQGASCHKSGAGGGWFGGGAAYGGGGGSGYIGNSRLISSDGVTKHMTGYGVATSTAADTYTLSTSCYNGGVYDDCAKSGHGYAAIDLVRTGPYLNSLTVKKGNLKETFAYNKFAYTWIIPKGVDTLTDDDVTAPPMYQGTTVVIPESVEFTQDGDTFVIQTIEDGGERYNYTLTMQRYVSNDARLGSLEADKGVFNKAFNKDDTSYLLEIFDDAESVTFTGEAFEQDGEVIDGLGEIELTEHETNHTITVQAEDGTIKIYNVLIRKNMYLKNIILEGLDEIECEGEQCKLTPDFDPSKTSYTIKVPTEYSKLNVSYVPSAEDLTVGIRVNEVTYSRDYVLNRVKNVVTFKVYNDSNEVIKTYTMTIIRENSTSGKLKNLKVNKGKLVEDFNKSKYNYTWIIPKGTDVLRNTDVTATLFDTSSTAEIPTSVTYTQDGDTFKVTVKVKEYVTFNYTGGQQTFVAPYTGLYKLQVWGASGGNYNASNLGGFGGYSIGYANLTAGETLYVNVGGYGYGNGRHENLAGGYNGGGAVTNINSDGNQRTASGGGATHIATASGQLWQLSGNPGSVLIVAGGGGAGGGNSAIMGTTGGSGGGYIGGTSSTYVERNVVTAYATGGTQTGPGSGNYGGGGFGYGASSNKSGSGGGWYGGGIGAYTAGGGSGYIGNSRLISADNYLKHMTGYRVATSTAENTRTNSTTCVTGGPVADCAKSGHGYADITLMDAESISNTYTLTLQREISDDARLATLTSDKGIFTEEFDKDKDEYVLEMYHKETKVSFDATPFEQDAEVIDGLGEVDLPTDETEHEITVQAEDGTIKIYKVIIRRNMYLEDLGLNGLENLSCKSYECEMTPSFSPEIIYYEYRVPLDYNILDVYYEPASAEHRSEMTINDEPYEEGYHLPYTGITTVKVHVYNDDDEIVKTYTMNVIKKYEEKEEFEYTGNYQTFKAPRTGKYFMQTWGAQGGSSASYAGGKGAYASGYIELEKDQILFVYVGEQGNLTDHNFNGGGKSYNTTNYGAGGGGATDIRLKSGSWNNSESLASRIMVAGAGGGASFYSYGTGGAGGTLVGLDGVRDSRLDSSYAVAKGGTQTYGGAKSGCGPSSGDINYCADRYPGGFGYGGDSARNSYETNYRGGGGGSGYYGGGGGADGYAFSGAGGSSFISGHSGSVAVQAEDNLIPIDGCANGTTDIECSYHYSGLIFTDTVMKAGTEEMPTHDNEDTMTGNTGDGYAKIELEETETMLESLSVDDITLVEPFDKFRTEYTWIIPKGKDEFTSDDVEAVLLRPDKAHLEMPEDPVQFTQDGDKFVFKVIADNGEEDTYTLTMVRYKSDDARLKSLETDKGILSPEFNPDENNYIINVYEDVDKITLDAETIDPNAIISSGLGEIELEENEVTTEILVTAEDGTTNVYTVIIRKDAYLLYLGLTGLDTVPCVEDECTLVPPFEPDSNEYNIKVPYEYANIYVYYLLASDEYTAQIKLNGNTYTEGASLPVGESTVVVDIYNSNNVLVNTYTMIVNRQKGNYATLENLVVNVGDLDLPFSKDNTEYTWIIPFDTDVLLDDYITATPTDPAATVSMPESVTYSHDGDEFNITVTAEDGVTTKTYKLILQKDIIEDIEVEENMLITVGETKNLYVNGLPDGCAGKFLYEIDQNAIAYVYENGDVLGTFPGTADITISVKNHPEIEPKTVNVTVISDKLQSDIYDVREADPDNNKDRIVIGAEPQTTVSDYKGNMLNPNEYLHVYDSEGNELDDDSTVKTGLVIKLEVDGTVHDEAYIVVRGDVNKDGFVNMADYMIMQNHYLEMEEITEYVSYAAADVMENDVINMQDTMKLLNYYTEQINTLNE